MDWLGRGLQLVKLEKEQKKLEQMELDLFGLEQMELN